MRIAVVDVGTNSTRLYIADVADGAIADEIDRRTTVTRLGQGVDRTGELRPEAMARVDRGGRRATATIIDASAVDADDRRPHLRRPRRPQRRRLHRAPQRGLQHRRADDHRRRGGAPHLPRRDQRPPGLARAARRRSTSAAARPSSSSGMAQQVDFHVSTQAGVVRQTERFLKSDPPRPEELQLLQDEASEIFAAAVPVSERARRRHRHRRRRDRHLVRGDPPGARPLRPGQGPRLPPPARPGRDAARPPRPADGRTSAATSPACIPIAPRRSSPA